MNNAWNELHFQIDWNPLILEYYREVLKRFRKEAL